STREGGFLAQVDAFNPEFFGISAREAVSMDPQQRLLLEVGWEALENASLAPEHLYNSSTGVFIGIYINDYNRAISSLGDPTQIDAFSAIGNSLSVAAGRLSYVLGLKGPSMAVDTSCSSSLVTVHLACQSLRLGECNLALAGGVGLNLVPDTSIALSRTRMLNPDGRCKTFDATASGFVKGEGCGVILLKRLSDALADGDNILALIRGSAVNHNGRSSSLIAPNGPSEQAVIRQALENGGVDSAQIDYVEVQGTGTSVGEPIEVAALGEVYGKNRPQDQPLVIGSVKTNMGHLEPASGVASLIKVVLALQHGEIPPHLHFEQPNPYINWDKLPLKVPTERMPWHAREKRRLAGVSAFGFSGTNAHVVLEEAPVKAPGQRSVERPLHILALSAKTDEALVQLAERYEKHLTENPDLALGDICFTANSGRSHFQHRLSVIVSSCAELSEKLAAFSVGQEAAGLFKGKALVPPKIAFFFTGLGSEYVGMGRQLYETQPAFRSALDHCNELLRPYLEEPLLEVLFASPAPLQFAQRGGPSEVPSGGDLRSDFSPHATGSPALFALEYALFQLWKSWGIEPDAVIGRDIGEFVAACVAGVFSLEDGLKLVMESVLGNFEQVTRQVTYSQPRISLVSNLTGELATAQIATPEYWCRRVQQPLSAASMNTLAQQGYEIFVEVGPKPILDDWQQLLESLGTLYVHGVKIDWSGFDRDYSRQRVQLPTYPWQRKRYWFEPNSNGHRNGQPSTTNLLGQTESEFVGTTESEGVLVQQLNLRSLTADDIQAWLVGQIAKELGVKPDDIHVRVPFDSYGLDSVLAIGIASAGKQSLGLEMSPLLLIHYPTIESLSQYLAKQLEASESELFEV
ncbi:MAG: acyltransferase domain-containing protein, partial [Chroococcidiopsidaceae cyanobacterium CP_BM_RX_35]|nr:acyltransferase domain-containing protein [Chroococcidiopsidaceae cyanobacterium CP_BM_RX_35]